MSRKGEEVQKVKVTAIVPVEVRQEAEKMAAMVVREANTIVVEQKTDEEVAYELLQKIGKAKNSIELRRKSITDPINRSLKEINAMFKQLAEPFGAADEIIRNKIMNFRKEEEEKAKKEQEGLRKKEEEAREQVRLSQKEANKAKNKKDEEEWTESAEEWKKEAVVLEERIEDTKAEVATSTTTVKRWVWEIVDEKEIPREYLQVSSTAVNAAVRDGVREIPGIKIYQKEAVRL